MEATRCREKKMENELDTRIKAVAEYCLSQGISVIPIGYDKCPAYKWGGNQHEPLAEWNFPGCNIAIITGEINNLVVVDCDTEESWRAWEDRMEYTPLRSKSRRGMHYYYRYPGTYIKSDSHIRLDGHPYDYDVRGGGGYVIFPPSIVKAWQYSFWPTKDNPLGRFIKPEHLPAFKPEWRPEHTPEDNWDSQEIKSIEKYISKIEATQGNGGDAATYKVCCLLHESGVPELDAMALLSEWNQKNASPPWTPRDLSRKLKLAYAK